MPGRKPTPTTLRLLRGNPGKRKLPKREPKPQAGIPPRPDWLSTRGAEAWDRLSPQLYTMGVLTLADGDALALLCEAWAEWRDRRDDVAKHGVAYECETEKGGLMVRARPEVAMASDAWRRVIAAMGEFGLTPSSRSKVSSGKSGEVDPMEEFLGRGKA